MTLMEDLVFLGLDYGSVRVGVAVAEVGVAVPLDAIDRSAGDIVDMVGTIIKSRKISDVVVGLPLRMDGREGPEAKRAREFGEAVRNIFSVRVHYIDERLTTRQVTRSLRDAGLRGPRLRSFVDSAAAVTILETFLHGGVQ